MNKAFVLLLGMAVALVVISCGQPAADVARWYSLEQVASGKILYAQYCADCHGESGQGATNWQNALPNGSYPAQPLNGSGHSWHHPLSQLEATITRGGTHPGATMPGFAEQLDRSQRSAVIAAFQEFWSDRTYRQWLGRGGLSR